MADDPQRQKAEAAPSPFKAFTKRLDRFSRTLTVRRKEQEREGETNAEAGSALGQAMRLSAEFIAAVVVGGGLGWALDHWFGTSPWGLIGCLMLGFVAGVLNVIRESGFKTNGG